MKISIITINYNDAQGLAKTLKSVASQVLSDKMLNDGFSLEHIIVDGGSTDDSIEVIKEYASRNINDHQSAINFHLEVKWVSEKDKGVYNAMNKGIKMASGEYIQILNAGDILASNEVLAKVRGKMEELRTTDASYPEMIYGNMLVDGGEGNFAGSKEIEYSLRQYYTSTMNHDCCWIKRTLFVNENANENVNRCYGLYDENLKIVSDWKWFLQAIGLGHVKPVYVDIDMTIFEGGGISSIQVEKRNAERRKVLEEVLPPAVLADYDKHAFDMHQMDNLRKHPWAYKLVWTLERVLNRLDNKNFRKPKNK